MPASGCESKSSKSSTIRTHEMTLIADLRQLFLRHFSTSRSRQHQAEHCTFKSVALLVAKRRKSVVISLCKSVRSRQAAWLEEVSLSRSAPSMRSTLKSQLISTHIKPYHICHHICIFCIFSGFSGSVMACPHCRQSFLFRMSTCLPILSVFCNFLQCRRR